MDDPADAPPVGRRAWTRAMLIVFAATLTAILANAIRARGLPW